MSTVQGPWPGRFVWHDLMTTDAARVVPFYAALFGWRLEEQPMAGFVYRKIHCGPGPIGGIVEEKGMLTSHWMPYLAVENVDATHNKVQTLGGTVCVPPTDIPATGRFAVVADPQGAYVSLFQGRPESPGCDPDLAVPGRICWNELLTDDDLAAQRFYSSLVGWRDAPKDMGPFGTYRVQTQRGKQACGIMKNPENGAPSCWLVYFLAPDLAASTQRAAQLGARVMMANQPIPGIGAFSLLADPAGAVFALFQPALGARNG